jgi:hypothetical protein
MKCPQCGSNLMIAKSEFKSDEGSTDVYNELTMVCVNSKRHPDTKNLVCDLYCGPDLNKPLKIAAVVRNKVN